MKFQSYPTQKIVGKRKKMVEREELQNIKFFVLYVDFRAVTVYQFT